MVGAMGGVTRGVEACEEEGGEGEEGEEGRKETRRKKRKRISIEEDITVCVTRVITLIVKPGSQKLLSLTPPPFQIPLPAARCPECHL